MSTAPNIPEPLIDVGEGDWRGTNEPTVTLNLSGIADKLAEALLQDGQVASSLDVARIIRNVLPGSIEAIVATGATADTIAEAVHSIEISLSDALDLGVRLTDMEAEFPLCLRDECERYAQDRGLCPLHAARVAP